jgi:hypothetical protein
MDNQEITARYSENKFKIFDKLIVKDQRREGFYKHFKGKPYMVHGSADVKIDGEMTKVVIYQAMYETTEFRYGQFWVRPYGMFFEEVVKDGYKGPRFVKTGDFY